MDDLAKSSAHLAISSDDLVISSDDLAKSSAHLAISLNNLAISAHLAISSDDLAESLGQRSAKSSGQRLYRKKTATAHAHVDLQRQPWLGFSQELICSNPLLALAQPSWV